jgi:hypothetical protein
MSKVLASILDQPEHVVKKIVAKLEDKNGYPSHDVRHLAENIQKTRTKIAELGLDPDDTTGEELYHRLLVKFQADSQQFDAQNNITSQDFSAKAAKAVELITKNLNLPNRWGLKTNAAKNLLRKQPPKKLMKQLKYRSLESLVKRESLSELYLAAPSVESKNWQKEQLKLLSKLDSSAFELRSVCIKYLPQAKWGLTNDVILTYDDNLGAFGLVESGDNPELPLLSMVVTLVEALSDLGHTNLSSKIIKLSPTLAWWSDMDGLVASLNSGNVSLSLSDVSYNAADGLSYDNRVLDSSRRLFWKNLVRRYDNQLEIEEDLLSGLKDTAISLKLPVNQPAFEYVEDI